MIGILIVTHQRTGRGPDQRLGSDPGPRGRGAGRLPGPQRSPGGLPAEDSSGALAQVNNGSGVIILTDMLGGTPSNLSPALPPGGQGGGGHRGESAHAHEIAPDPGRQRFAGGGPALKQSGQTGHHRGQRSAAPQEMTRCSLHPRGRPDGCQVVFAIEKDSFPPPGPAGPFWRSTPTARATSWWPAPRPPRPGKPWGYIIYWVVADEMHLLNLAVHPDHRGRGIARPTFTQAMTQRPGPGSRGRLAGGAAFKPGGAGLVPVLRLQGGGRPPRVLHRQRRRCPDLRLFLG